MSQTAPTPPCPYCQSANVGILSATMLLAIYLCFNCGRRFERKKQPGEKVEPIV